MSTAYELLPIFEVIIPYLEETGTDKEGIFRISGTKEQVAKVKTQMLRGEKVNLADHSVHILAGVVKALLRELAEPLFPLKTYSSLLQISEVQAKDARFDLIRFMIIPFPEINKKLLRILMRLLDKIRANSKESKMDAQNLATVLAPNIFRPRDETPEEMLRNSSKVVKFMEEFIENHQYFLSNQITPKTGTVTYQEYHRELIESQLLELSTQLASTSDKTVLVADTIVEMTAINEEVKKIESVISSVQQDIKEKLRILGNLEKELETSIQSFQNAKKSSVNENGTIENVENKLREMSEFFKVFEGLTQLYEMQKTCLDLHQELEQWETLYQNKKDELLKSDIFQRQSETLSVLYHWMVVAIRLEFASRGHFHGFDKENLFSHLIQHKIPFQSWPLFILKEATKAT
jgi:methyl-accepting chemotaxis protein